MSYIFISATNFVDLEYKMNDCAARGYALHSWSMLNTAQQGETMRYVAVMELSKVEHHVINQAVINQEPIHPILEWWNGLGETARHRFWHEHIED